MVRLISDQETVEKYLGFDIGERMLLPTQCHDRRTPLPLVLEQEKGLSLVVREVETSNLKKEGFAAFPVIKYHPYFLFEKDEPISATLAEALQNAGVEQLSVQSGLPYALYMQLKGSLKVDIERASSRPVHVYATTLAQVVGRFYTHGREIEETAATIAEGLSQGDLLKGFIAIPKDNRFEFLDSLLAGQRSVLASSLLCMQELLGLDWAYLTDRQSLALYNQGENRVYLISSKEVSLDFFAYVDKYANLVEAVRELGGGEVLIEEDDIECDKAVALEEAGLNLMPGSNLLRDWRERRVGRDVAYHIVAATVSRRAIESTLARAKAEIEKGSGITERELEAYYHQVVKDLTAEYQLPVTFKPYFTNLHSGSRSIYPSFSANYPLHEGINSLKIDAGLFILDEGLAHGCSDLARTLNTSPKGAALYEIMEEIVVDRVIPYCVSGRKASDVYWYGMECLAERTGDIKGLGMLPESFDFKGDYDRDIGHLLERQESFTFGLRRENDRPLEKGMVGCVEIQWPYRSHGIAIEDSFIVTDRGGVLISR
jgi:Xaa-Pro aminopeptidase